MGRVSTSWPRVVLLLLCGFAAVAAALPDPGFPTLEAVITSAAYDSTEVATGVANWLRINTALSSFGSAVNETIVAFFDETVSVNDHTVNMTISINHATNVDTYNALELLRAQLTADASQVLTNPPYTVSSAQLWENPALQVDVTIDPMSVVYLDQESPEYTIRLSASPRIGRSVTFAFSPSAGTVTFSVPSVTITYPDLSATFTANAGSTAGTCGVSQGGFTGDDQGDGRTYIADVASFATEFMTMRPLENALVTVASETQRLYAGRPSTPFTIEVSGHRDPTFSLVVTPVISPSGAATTPENITVSTAGSGGRQQFTVAGDPGLYTITYLIAPVYYVGIYPVGANNPDFNPISTSSTLDIRPTMNASSSSIPDAYRVHEVSSATYGGAYSELINFHLEREPVSGRTLTVTPSSSSQMDFFPASRTFINADIPSATFQYRAYHVGTHQISFALSGTAAGDYFVPSYSNPRHWTVHGQNLACPSISPRATCLETPGCAYDDTRGACSNTTLPVHIPLIPLLYDGEQSDDITITLPTAVATDLTITFEAAARLTFSPPSVSLTTGETTATFRVTGVQLSTDDDLTAQLFTLRMSGTDANTYTEEVRNAYMRPKVQCTVQLPFTAFYVRTSSDFYTIECDQAPETEVIFTPSSTIGGLEFRTEFHSNSSLHLHPGETSGRFYITSSLNNPGVGSLYIALSGENAPRYEAIAPSSLRLIPSGVVNPPPTFHMVAYTTSHPLHVDLSTPPPSQLNLTITVFSNNTIPADENITITPNVISYNDSVRGSFTITANGTGWYQLAFELNGDALENYQQPEFLVPFEVKDPMDGSAFTARLTPGYLGTRKQCRVSTGRSSVRFRGQAEVEEAENFCLTHPKIEVLPNETYDCAQWVTEERCKSALADTGNACVWFAESCQFVPEMQGDILSFAYGSGFTVFLNNAGEVWSMGNTNYGQLGHENSTWIAQVPLPENIAVIVAGANHVMALSYQGRVYSWGANHLGQLGLNTRTRQLIEPQEITFDSGDNITCISAGTLHSAAVTLSGRLYVWGSNEYGQLGTAANFRHYANAPVRLAREPFGGEAVIAVTLGEYHTMAATGSNAFTWGSNIMGQLGRSAYDDPTPTQPVHWVRDAWSAAPEYPSYLLGRDC